MSATTLRRACKVAKIDAVEVEFSPFETEIEVCSLLPFLLTRPSAHPFFPPPQQRSGVVAACKELGVKIFSYSPLGKGILTTRFKSFEDVKNDSRGNGMFPRFDKENFENNQKLVRPYRRHRLITSVVNSFLLLQVDALEQLAKKKGCTPGQLALAWGMQAHGDLIIPIPGVRLSLLFRSPPSARSTHLSPSASSSAFDLSY